MNSMDLQTGSPAFPEQTPSHLSSSTEAIDQAIQVLQEHKDAWVHVTVRERIALINQLIHDVLELAPRWVAASAQAKGFTQKSLLAGEEWGSGVFPILRNLQLIKRTLIDLDKKGKAIPGPVTTRANGQVMARVFPGTSYDKLFFPGVTIQLWMQPGVTEQTLAETQAVAYRQKDHAGKVALVLGAGNISSIGPTDVLYKLFVEDQVVIYKANPVNDYLGPLIEEALHSLITAGYLRLVYGGTDVGTYLCQHAGIDEIHITGSDKTFESIVFGPGAEGAQRKQQNQPLLHKRVSGELGNVSPFIIVPGPWSAADLAYQGEQIVSSLINNAAFNCNATRVIIQHADWPLRTQLKQQMRQVLAQLPARAAYYPGAQQRHQAFLQEHPEAEVFGTAQDGELPWTFIDAVDPHQTDDICFTTEAFCSLFAETGLQAPDVPTYIEQAVAFANEQLWGNLNVTLIVHPQSLRDPAIARAIEKAIEDLRYGIVGVNYWSGTAFVLPEASWGAFPGNQINNIQSGNGIVHNAYMFSRLQKSVIQGPFRSFPKPVWFATEQKKAGKVSPRLANFTAEPSPWKVPAILRDAIF